MDKNLEKKQVIDKNQPEEQEIINKKSDKGIGLVGPRAITFLAIALLLAAVPLTVFLVTQKSPTNTKSSASSDAVASADEVQQGIEDSFYAGLEKEFLDKHPWYNSIPKDNKDYFIGFDPETEEFFIDVYVDKTAPSTTVASETNSKEVSATNTLKSIGVDTTKYKINWTVNPTTPEP